MNAPAIVLIIFIIVVVIIILGWLIWRHRQLIDVNNVNNSEFLRAYTNLQLVIDQLEADTGDIITASINTELDKCDELFINRYPDRVEDLDTSFTDLKAVSTADPDIIISDEGMKLSEAVNKYTSDIANAQGTFDLSVTQGGSKCSGPAFDAVNQAYITARPNVRALNLVLVEITKSLR
jgi:type II secretory pathway pseudopilin PulG